jgi:hypothetical protein
MKSTLSLAAVLALLTNIQSGATPSQKECIGQLALQNPKAVIRFYTRPFTLQEAEQYLEAIGENSINPQELINRKAYITEPELVQGKLDLTPWTYDPRTPKATEKQDIGSLDYSTKPNDEFKPLKLVIFQEGSQKNKSMGYRLETTERTTVMGKNKMFEGGKLPPCR